MSVSSFVTALMKQCKPEELEAFRQSLSRPARAFIDTPPPAQTWVPLAIEVELVDRALDTAFRGDRGRLRKAATDAAVRDFTGAYRIFIKVLAPVFLIQRVGLVWSMVYRNNGTFAVTRLDEAAREVCFRVDGVGAVSPTWWDYLLTSIEAVVALTRVREPILHTTRGGGSDRFLEFRCRW